MYNCTMGLCCGAYIDPIDRERRRLIDIYIPIYVYLSQYKSFAMENSFIFFWLPRRERWWSLDPQVMYRCVFTTNCMYFVQAHTRTYDSTHDAVATGLKNILTITESCRLPDSQGLAVLDTLLA